ncbi:hypothetical protein [Azospirillum doebereinerae]|uniref:Uncharacterized protein n=1 Tax=Azospirillum doebereinerae TaxID=92933 RepID=A0A3S0V308_9PROT|nr:hypothetical protein [Azospirillum doebereinerae]MCG5243447.1 hypothetical protein [Azospirillum doebereinerae]RUQ63261.1 hypothetical protein EJ913_27725 [Azospirillum doebereinerae]
MALLDRDGRDEEGGWLDGLDRRLLVVALALGLLTLLAVLDLNRPVPGSELPVEVHIPAVDLSFAARPATKPARDRDELLAYD